ncbi:hypothetical protein [Xenophilus sp. Marseille-Q4582]|uniref:hypothetical protein n=1 Tax=Xenophilus sp. Marseille-Q4582 TaxID=2866600 RepID=UPI001CE45E45|nr:hypothetical protein [Xenophilus sp. Marseille-Q4582]
MSEGENPAYIAKLLGHKNTEMVIRNYARWVDQGAALGFERPAARYGRESLPGLPAWPKPQEGGKTRVRNV